MPYLCKIRTDIPDGVLQVLDLSPNTSLRNAAVDAPGQTKYCSRVQSDTVKTKASGGDDVTVADYRGLAAYLLDRVEQGGLAAGTSALTDANANAAAAAIIAIMDSGAALTLADVDAALSGVVANTELTSSGGSNSNGSLTDLLSILAGAEYFIPAGSVTESPTGTFATGRVGTFTSGKYRATYESGAFNISNGEGQLAAFKAADFSYLDVLGAALVVYGDDGSVL